MKEVYTLIKEIFLQQSLALASPAHMQYPATACMTCATTPTVIDGWATVLSVGLCDKKVTLRGNNNIKWMTGGGVRFGPIPGSRARGAIGPCPGSWNSCSS